MKHLLTYIFLLLGMASFAQAQPVTDRQQKVEALYVAYMTKELNLTADDAQKFWPVHSQYDNEIRGLKNESAELERQQAGLNIKKKYQDRFVKILGAQRTNDFYVQDGEFRKKLVERLRKMRQQNMNQRPMQQRQKFIP